MNEKDLRTKKRVINTFEVIFDASTGDREDLFASLCGEDLSLRREVETMLKAAVSLDDFMETPAAETAFEVYENYLSDNLLGRKIGNYRLVSAIGQGGMGTVFLGKRDDEIDQLVAIKIISPFATNESDAENFKRERQILARLEHANISRLIDAGTTADGTPFLVMEYVKGVSLTNYCSTKALSLSARLELFLEVCEAVRFAHQNLVIHRDLKPTNILVTEDGKPKLLDFGIAKMLQPKPFEPVTEFTLTTKILTPNYASPEQLKGESITTASDVYSLGVILYEMLTGKRPYDLQNMALPEILKTISEEIPEKPYKSAISKSSELRKDSSPPPDDRSMPVPDPRMLKGDIDTIILKSLEKDVSERYQTVEQLAGDIGRFLNNLPILAKPPSNIYKFRKFVRRNRLPFVSVCAATVLGLILIVSSVWFARVSDRQARTYLRQAYSSDMNLAMQSYETANIIRVRQLLDRYSDFRYRGWEYDYLQNLAEPKAKISTLKHDSEVWNVVFSPNGDRMATACADGFARIYEVPSGKLIVSTKIRERNIWKLVFSPDGAFLATASGDSSSTSVRIWNTQNGEEVISLVGHTARVRGITYSPNGKTIATGSQDGTIRLWDPISGKQKQVIKLPFFMNRPVETHDLAFSPDGKWLLSGNGSSALIFDLSAKKIIPVTEEIGACLAVAFSPDGKKIAVGTQESTINVYDSETLLKKFKIEVHNAPIRDVEFSPDGRVLASASSDRTVGFFDSETGLELTDIRTHTSDVWSVAFSPKGSYFASGSTDFDAHLFNREELYRVFSFGSAAGFSQQWSAITMDGKKLATGERTDDNGSTHAIYDVNNPQKKVRFSKEIISAGAFEPNGKSLATLAYDGTIAIWDSQSGAELFRFKAHAKQSARLTSGQTLVYSPDGKQIISGGYDNLVMEWDTKTGTLVRKIFEFDDRVSRVGVSLDATRIFAASFDSTARLFDFHTGELIADLGVQPKPILSVAFDPFGKTFATGGADGVIKIWSLKDGKQLKTYAGNAGFIWQLTFSPDGRRLVSASGEGVIRLWDTESDLEVMAMRTNSAVTNLLAFTPDGSILISHGTNERIRLREAPAR